MLQPGEPCVQKPAVRDGVVKYGWIAGDTREVRAGVGGVGTYTVKYEVDPEESARSCQGIRTLF